MSKGEKNQPMDTSIREEAVAVPVTNNQRVCWAAKTFVAEVNELFPETPVEYSNYDGRNTALGVTFDLSMLDSSENQLLVDLLTMKPYDPRIIEVAADYDTQSVYLRFKADPRTQDLRDPFGLADAYEVLIEDEQ